MAGTVRIAVLANAAQAKSELNDVAGSADGMGSKLGRAGKFAGAALAGGLAVAGVAAVKFGASAVKSASDAQQSLGATETVFGKFAGTVIKTSNDAATKFGLSANEYRENANLIGSLFKGQGVSVDQLAGKTKSMIGTAADLSATFGGTTKEAVEALGSAYKGEFDPLERYGISMKQSDISARLAAKGQDKLTGAALKQATQAAATDIIMKQAAQTQGAFGKESDTLAHQQQVLGAKWENLKATVGTALLPVLTKLATFASDRLIPGISRLWQSVQPAIARFKSLFTTTGQGQSILSTLGGIISRVGGFIVSTLVPAVFAFYKRVAVNLLPIVRQLITTFQTRVLPTLIRVTPTVVRIVSVVARAAAKFLVFGSAVSARVLPVVIRFAGFLFSKVVPAVVKVIAINVRMIGIFARVVVAIGRGIAAFARFAAGVGRAIGRALGFVGSIPGRVRGALGNAGSILYGAGKAIIGGLVNGFLAMFGKVKSVLGNLTGYIRAHKGPPARDRRLLTPAGRMIIGSLIKGFDAETPAVKAKLQRLSRDISTFSASPSATLDVNASGAYASQTARDRDRTLTIKLTAEQASALQRGREIKADIRAYERAGGK